MDERHPTNLDDGPVARVASHFATGIAGVAVIVVCGGYVVWSLAQGRMDEERPTERGVLLGHAESTGHEPSLTSPPGEAADLTLTLDNGVEPLADPVVNADHVEPAFDEWSDEFSVSTSTIRPLTHETGTDAAPSEREAAWLSGTIELPSAEDAAIAPFIR